MSTFGCSLSPSARNSAVPSETVASPSTSLRQAFCPMPNVKHLHKHIKHRISMTCMRIKTGIISGCAHISQISNDILCRYAIYEQSTRMNNLICETKLRKKLEMIFHDGRWRRACCLSKFSRDTERHFILTFVFRFFFFSHRDELANFIPSAMSLCILNEITEGRIKWKCSLLHSRNTVSSLIVSVIMICEVLMEWPSSVDLRQSSGGSHPLKGGYQKSVISRVT